MSIDYGIIISAKFGNTCEIYSSANPDKPNITLLVRDKGEKEGTKFVLNEGNIDYFLSSISCALKELKIKSEYLNTV